ncbi:uncharacterized protein LOC127871706 [Dreissena polymorpha]|uniref:uncharacterized protein LOC127871706 n=1 Tax=Dreissena polymorpha TaxID=45954 RepID=UPI0022647C75|nr:uncharacterized protein LOC127871706 [Dreissena polymorpha]
MAFRSALISLAIVAVCSSHELTFRWESEVAPTDDFNGRRHSEKEAVFQDVQKLMAGDVTPWCQCLVQSCSCCVDRTVTVDGKNGRMSACLAVEVWSPISYDVSFGINGLHLYQKVQRLDANIRECFPASSQKQSEICFELSKNTGKNWCAALYGTHVDGVKKETDKQALGCFELPK